MDAKSADYESQGSRSRDARDVFCAWLGTLMPMVAWEHWLAFFINLGVGLLVIMGYVIGTDVGKEDVTDA